MTTIIRKGNKDDIPSIHALVGELAAYEEAAEEFVASIDTYYQDFDANVFEVTVAEIDGKVVGMVLYYMAYSTWKGKMLYLEDFVVQQKFRRTGIGQQLFEAFLREATDKGCVLTKWQVLDWNEPAIKFYEKIGSEIERNWWNCKLFIK